MRDLAVHLAGAADPVTSIPKTADGVAVVSLVIGDGNALGWATGAHTTGLPYGATPMRSWIWGKFGPTVAERYITPTRLFDRWMPMALGTGQHPDRSTDQTIGPEFMLGAKRVEMLRQQCDDPKQNIDHYVIKLAAYGSRVAPSRDPRMTWAVPYDGLAGEPRELEALEQPGSLANLLLSEYIEPAMKALRDGGRLVLVDALYIVLGENDCEALEELKEAPRQIADTLRELVTSIEDAMGVESIQIVIARPRENEARAPRVRTELVDQQLSRWAEQDVRVHLLSMANFAVQRDLVHLTTQAQIGLGQQMAFVWENEMCHLREPEALNELKHDRVHVEETSSRTPDVARVELPTEPTTVLFDDEPVEAQVQSGGDEETPVD